MLLTERGPVCSILFSAATASPPYSIALCTQSLLQAILFGERGVDPSLVSFNRTVLLHGAARHWEDHTVQSIGAQADCALQS